MSRLLLVAYFKEKDSVLSNEKIALDIFKIIYKEVWGWEIEHDFVKNPDVPIGIIEKIIPREKMTMTQLRKIQMTEKNDTQGTFQNFSANMIGKTLFLEITKDTADLYQIWEDYLRHKDNSMLLEIFEDIVLSNKDNFIKHFETHGHYERVNGPVFQYIPDEWKGDKEFLKELVKRTRGHDVDMTYIDKDWKTNKELCLEIIKENGLMLMDFCDSLKADKECLLMGLESGCPGMIFYDDKNCESLEVCVRACEKGMMVHDCQGITAYMAFPYPVVPEKFADEPSIIIAQLRARNGVVCKHWIDMIKQDEILFREALKANGELAFSEWCKPMLNIEVGCENERELLILAMRGACVTNERFAMFSDKEIAENYGLSYKTINNHRNVFAVGQKLNYNNLKHARELIKLRPWTYKFYTDKKIQDDRVCISEYINNYHKFGLFNKSYTKSNLYLDNHDEFLKVAISIDYRYILCAKDVTPELVRLTAIERHFQKKIDTQCTKVSKGASFWHMLSIRIRWLLNLCQNE